MNKNKGLISLIIASILFSTYGIFSRILEKQLTVFQQLSYRYFIGIIIISVIILFITKEKINIKKFLNKQMILFMIIVPFSFYLFIKSFLVSDLSVSISGFYGGMIISTLFIGTILLKEKLTTISIIAIIITFIGFVFLNDLNFKEITQIGLFYGLISGVLYGLNSYLKKVAGTFTKLEMLLAMSVSTVIVLQSLSFLSGEKLVVNLDPLIIIILFVFIIVALLAEYLTIVGFRNFDILIGSIVLALEIFFTVIVGYIFFKEIPSRFELIGIFLIFVSVVLTNLPWKLNKSS